MSMLRAIAVLALAIWGAAAPGHSQGRSFDPDSYQSFDGRQFNVPAGAEIAANVMAEVNEGYEACLGLSEFNRVHDCGCEAMTVLEARLAAPEAAIFTLRQDAAAACVDPDLVETVEVQKCLNSSGIWRRIEASEAEKDEQCGCVGATVRAAFDAQPDVKSRAFQSVRADARRACIRL